MKKNLPDATLVLSLRVCGYLLLLIGIIGLLFSISISVISYLRVYWSGDIFNGAWVAYDEKDFEGIKSHYPYVLGIIRNVMGYIFLLVLLLLGRELIQLYQIYSRQGIFTKGVSAKIRRISQYVGLFFVFKVIGAVNEYYQSRSLNMDFILDLIVGCVIVVLFYTLIDVLLKAIDLKKENDLTI